MPRVYTSKYDDFHVSEPILRRGKHSPYTETNYVDILCPHCNETFEMAQEALKAKASACLKHLRECTKYEGSVSEAPSKRRKTAMEEKLDILTEEVRGLRNEIGNVVSTVANMTKLGPPPPTNKEELLARLGEREEGVSSTRTRLQCLDCNMSRIDEAETCGVCLEKVSDTIFTPCLHRNVCWGDWQTMQATAVAEGQSPTCPTCRTAIQKALRVVI